MRDVEPSADSRERTASELRLDRPHSFDATKSKEARQNETDSSNPSLQVEPFPFSHVSANERRQIEIQVGETLVSESRLDQLCRGDLVKLDATVDDDVVVWCGGHRVARGKMVVANGRLAVRLAESPKLNVGEN